MVKVRDRYSVFISHSSVDTWVARQIARHVEEAGASAFLDAADIDHGDDFEDRILEAADGADEALVLLTPWAKQSRYLLMEIGIFWGQRKRIVVLLHGESAESIGADAAMPVRLKRTHFLELNEIEGYLSQLRARVGGKGREDG